VQKTKLLAVRWSAFRQIGPGGFEQTEGAVDIGTNESLGAGERTVNVALGREVHDGARLIPVEQAIEQRRIADIALLETVGRKLLDRGKVLQIARIRELVEVDHWSAHQRKPNPERSSIQ